MVLAGSRASLDGLASPEAALEPLDASLWLPPPQPTRCGAVRGAGLGGRSDWSLHGQRSVIKTKKTKNKKGGKNRFWVSREGPRRPGRGPGVRAPPPTREAPPRRAPQASEARVLRGGRKGRKWPLRRPEVTTRLHRGPPRPRPLPVMAAPELEQLLGELLEPESGRIRRATARLREAFADPATPTRLSLLLAASPRPQVRQLAAVLLRRRILGRWRRLDPALRQRLPALLAEALERETEHPVTVALAQLAALVLRRGGPERLGAPLGPGSKRGAQDPRAPPQELFL
ncbi:uncharacterized protein LOC134153000 [Rhea pennata]|uniref:uncharacterized protein LOC134153000 n=1 Tax=Rhea pennata TaxID=8795 RepID=UPI002E271BE1